MVEVQLVVHNRREGQNFINDFISRMTSSGFPIIFALERQKFDLQV